MTFANLSNSTELTTPKTLASYTVFFALAWWLWAAQVVYDVKVRAEVFRSAERINAGSLVLHE
jgi:hypothetical protein